MHISAHSLAFPTNIYSEAQGKLILQNPLNSCFPKNAFE